LYELEKDMGERNNLASGEEKRAARMKERLRAWIVSCGAVVPGPNPSGDPARELEEVNRRA
jgi:hypothetical protein